MIAPAYLTVPAHATSSNGAAAAELAEMAGLVMDDEQRAALDAILAVDDQGRWAAIDSAIICPRQNGKTVVLQVIALADLFLFDSRLVIWSAHLFPTAMEAFRDLEQIITTTPELAKQLKRGLKGISRENGNEGFELVGDRRLKFRARSKTGGRGLTGDRVILDEAFAIQAGELGSLYPTLSARPNPSVLYASSAGMVGSDVLRGLRERGRKGGDESLCWIEWCAPEGDCATPTCEHRPDTPGCLLDDHDRWQQANPAMGRRITVRYLEAERRTLDAAEFARERLGWWEDPAEGASGIPSDKWQTCADREAAIEEPCVLAFDVTPGHTAASIVVCGGALHVVDHAAGTSWVVDRLHELVAEKNVSAVGMDPASPAAALIPELEKSGLTIRNPKNPKGQLVLLEGRESVMACEEFLAGILDGTVVHRDQHVLNTAVVGAGRRQVGDSWKWSRRDSTVDITPLVAATVARHLWATTEQAPPRTWFGGYA